MCQIIHQGCLFKCSLFECKWSYSGVMEWFTKIVWKFLFTYQWEGKSFWKYWIMPNWILLCFSAVFYIRIATDWVGVCITQHFFDEWGITYFITASQAHKHTIVRVNILVVHFQFSTEPSSSWLFPLGTKWLCFLLQIGCLLS